MTPPPATQASLFDAPVRCPDSETRAEPFRQRDDARLRLLVSQLGRHPDPVQRLRLALELAALADAITTEAINDARRAGRSWRQLGVDLGVPFQTLFRRYGGNRSGG